MPESIQLHFHSASATQVLSRVAAFTEKVEGNEQYFYPQNAGYLLIVTPCESYCLECDIHEQAEIERLLNARPSASLDLELRRTQSDAACDALVELIKALSADFRFIIDDNCNRLWTISDALSSTKFLAHYRYNKLD